MASIAELRTAAAASVSQATHRPGSGLGARFHCSLPVAAPAILVENPHMGNKSIVCAAALAGAFATPCSGQIQVFGGTDTERTASTVVLVGKDVAAGASISFSGGKWKDEYDKVDALLDSMKGTNQRLGKNWWTTLDTSVALEIAGTKVPAGAYFLGLHIDARREVHLLVIDSGKAMQNGWLPWAPAPWMTDRRAPLTLDKNKLSESQATMAIELTADKKDPASSSGALAIRWGKHELSAPVKFFISNKPGDAKKPGEDAAAADRATAKTKALTDVRTIAEGAKLYRIKNNRVPSLEDLTTPDEKGYAYVEGVAKDPWGHDYLILSGDRPGSFYVLSCGPNGKQGDDDDITSKPPAR
jgi:hypothetical protein